MPRTTPTSRAASTTPQKLPRPPITTTTKATVMISAPIAGCTIVIGAKKAPPERRHADAEHDDGGHVGLQPDAERGDHVRPLDAGAHHAAERGLVQQQPDAEQHRGDHGEEQQPIAREQEVAEEHRAASAPAASTPTAARAPQMMRIACSATMASPNVTSRLRIGSAVVEAAQDEALEQDAEQRRRRPATAPPPGRSRDIS